MAFKKLIASAAACVATTLVASSAEAQVPYVVGYRPVTAFYAPAPYVVASPVIQPAPVVAYYAPAPTVVYQPAARVVTRYRPLLGGSVTRVRPAGYVPVVYP
ncbi:MAG: hypothetical protein KF688_09740 [Pirellulales bacterium]|nr:hypothetical protein [Pirellulales bacterium]